MRQADLPVNKSYSLLLRSLLLPLRLHAWLSGRNGNARGDHVTSSCSLSVSFSPSRARTDRRDNPVTSYRVDLKNVCSGRPLSAKQLLMGDNVSAPVAADALYTALDDLMARAGALTAERRCDRLDSNSRLGVVCACPRVNAAEAL